MKHIFGFLLFFYSFTASGIMRPSYSQTCFSPVEMAALFSKPGKKKSKTKSLGKLKREYRSLERKILLKENKLEDIKGRLADSLKGGARKGTRIANKIEEYMSNKYDGWECSKGVRGAQNSLPSGFDIFEFLFSGLGFSDFGGEKKEKDPVSIKTEQMLRENASLFEENVFLAWLIPMAEAQTEVAGSDWVSRGVCRQRGSDWEWQRARKRTDGRAPCIQKEREESESLITEKQKCEDVGKVWTGSECITKQKECLDQGKVWTGSECITKQKECLDQGKVWTTDNKCITKKKQCENAGKAWTRDNECITKKKQCEDAGNVWTGSECITKQKQCEDAGKVWTRDNKCITKKKQCEDTGKVWTRDNKCITKKKQCEDVGKVWTGSECITKKKQCEDAGKVWTRDNKCITKKKQCEDAGKVWTGSECITKKKQCEDVGKVWTGSECITKKKQCEDAGKVWTGSECITKQKECLDQGKVWTTDNKCITKKKQCENAGKAWTRDNECITKKKQCEDAGNVWTGSECITKQKQCEDAGKVWTRDNKCITKKKQCEDTGKVWTRDNKCITKKKQCEDVGKVWTGSECITKKKQCEDAGKVWTRDNKCITKKKQCEDAGKVWTGSECITKKKQCEDVGKVWTGSECITKKKQCEDAGKVWTRDNKCITKKKQCEDAGKVWTGSECITKKKQCEDAGKVWTRDNKCITKKKQCEDAGKVWTTGGRCISIDEDRCRGDGVSWTGSKCVCEDKKLGNCECGDGQTEWKTFCKPTCGGGAPHRGKDGDCKKCPDGQEENADWQNDGAFEDDGKVDKSFCERHAKSRDVSDCKKALADMKRLLKELDRLRKQLEKKEEAVSDKEISMLSDDKPKKKKMESDLCVECLRDLRAMNRRLSGSQVFGNILSMGIGAYGSYFGHREAKLSQASTNELLSLQGHPIENNLGYSLAGVSVGIPFLARGIYGLTQGNGRRNSYNCSPAMNPYPHYNRQGGAYQYQHTPYGRF